MDYRKNSLDGPVESKLGHSPAEKILTFVCALTCSRFHSPLLQVGFVEVVVSVVCEWKNLNNYKSNSLNLNEK
jgi:hypothetical protein